ncbi:MAG: hypothetical protein WAL59_21990, partial [Roseiarcus sp.]
LLAVPEIMFELIAVVFQNVEALVLDFPSRTAAGDDFGEFRPGVSAVSERQSVEKRPHGISPLITSR